MQSPIHSARSLTQTDIFETVREISLEAILSRYAPTEPIVKAGRVWILCPFHKDKNPSLSVKGQRWRCFGCGAWGDGVDFVAKLYGLSLIEAAERIARDFGLSVNSVLSQKQRENIAVAKKARQAKRAFDQAVERAYQQLCDVRIECCKIIDNSGENGLRFSHVPDMLDTYLDVLQFGTDAEKREILNTGVAQHWACLLPGSKEAAN